MDRRKPEQILEDHGPFTYTYIAVIAVPGMKLPEGMEGDLKFYSFPEQNAEVILTSDWDKYCIHMDRCSALRTLMLTAFRGAKRFGKLSVFWHRLMVGILGNSWMFRKRFEGETRTARTRRHKSHKSPGCYLVYKAEGDLLEPLRLDAARKNGTIGYGIDVLRGEPYRDFHRRVLHGAVTSLSLAMIDTNGSPDTHFLEDIIYLTGKDGLLIYRMSFKGGLATLVTSSFFHNSCLDAAKQYISAMLAESQIETAVSIFVQSQNKSSDNLRSFIASWSALELLVNRLAKMTRADWHDRLKDSSINLPNWDKNLINTPPEDYRLRDVFYSVSCVLDLDSARLDTQTFIDLNKKRGDYYHQMKGDDKDLPTNEVQKLFRKYLRLWLAYQSKRASVSE